MGSFASMRSAVARPWPNMRRELIGLTLEEGKHLLAALQVHLVQAQAENHSRRRRRCQRCGAQRPLKDQRSRRLVSLFGTVEVRAPRFTPCRCAVTCRRTLNPIAEIMPDRCTPEHERTIAKTGSLFPGPGRCWRSFSARQATGRGNHPAANPSCWHSARARGCRGGGSKPSVQRNLSRSPLTAATCGRLVSIRGARSMFSSLRSATMRGSGSYSPACRRRRLRRRDSCAVCCLGWARHQRHRSPS